MKPSGSLTECSSSWSQPRWPQGDYHSMKLLAATCTHEKKAPKMRKVWNFCGRHKILQLPLWHLSLQESPYRLKKSPCCQKLKIERFCVAKLLQLVENAMEVRKAGKVTEDCQNDSVTLGPGIWTHRVCKLKRLVVQLGNGSGLNLL